MKKEDKKNKSGISIIDIKLTVTKYTGVNLARNSRQRRYVYARAIYFKLCREFSHATLFEIGKSVKRDHASVFHGLSVFNTIVLYSDSILSIYSKIKGELLEFSVEALKKYNEDNYFRIKYEALLEDYNKLLKTVEDRVEEEV